MELKHLPKDVWEFDNEWKFDPWWFGGCLPLGASIGARCIQHKNGSKPVQISIGNKMLDGVEAPNKQARDGERPPVALVALRVGT